MLVTLLTAAGCGSATSQASKAETSSDFAAIEARADDIYTMIGGDAREREAAHYLTVAALNEDFIACMGEAGLEVASPFHPIWAGWEPNSTSGLWMGELNRPLSTQALALAESTRSEFEGARGPAYDKAVRLCDKSDLDDPGAMSREPNGWPDLDAKYSALINEVDAELGPIAEYTQCMKKAGIDYVPLNREDLQGFQGLYLALQVSMPDAPLPDEEPTKEWARYLEFEASAMSADAACRQDRHHKGLNLLAPQLDQFEADNHDAIEDLHAQWKTVLAEAERLKLPV